jgi:hypothetical protein
MADNAPVSRQSRIPFTLQAVFLASNRGKEVHKPPPENVGSRVFKKNWFLQRKPRQKKDTSKAEGSPKASQEKKAEKRKAEKGVSDLVCVCHLIYNHYLSHWCHYAAR